MTNIKYVIVIIILSSTIALSHLIPKADYVGTDFMSKLNVPIEFKGWRGKDVSEYLDINLEEAKFNFISDVLAHQYTNDRGGSLLFILLDAGNFHHPKNCFVGSGFEVDDLPDTEFQVQDMSVKVHTLFSKKGKESILHFYWIVIDKNIAHEWIEQKFKQFYQSLFSKKRVALMVRLDIPTKEEKIKESLILAEKFINDLNASLKRDEADFIFGKF